MADDWDIAGALFEVLTGEKPPAIDDSVYPEWAKYRFDIQDQDGTKPFYEAKKNERTLILYLHEGQRQTWDSDARFTFMIAGKQSGKTTFGPLRLLRMIQERGAGDYLAISATYDLFQFKMLPALKDLFVHDLGIAKYHAGLRTIEICNPYTGEFATSSSAVEQMWCRIILRSADSEEGLQSATAKGAWLDEAGLYRNGVWKDVRGRLTLHQGEAFGTTTPYAENWLKTTIYDAYKDGKAEYNVVQFTSLTNPFFSQAEWDSLQDEMQTWQFNMDYGGEFERPPGLIYEDFINEDVNQGGHTCKRFTIPDSWDRYFALDPGIINPGKLWIARDPATDVFYIYEADKGGKRKTSKEHARDDIERAEGWRVVFWAIGAKSEKYWREDYEGAGAKNVREPDVSDVEEGIDRVTHLIKKYRMIVFDDLKDLLYEVTHYSREIDPKTKQITDKIKDKSIYHLLDAVRYFAVQAVKKSKRKITVGVSYDNYA